MKQPSVIQLKRSPRAVKFCGCGRLIGLATVKRDTCGRKACSEEGEKS
jgi:hypothetical protein